MKPAAATTMKKWSVTSPGAQHLKLETEPIPTPGDYEVLVREGAHLERCEVAAPGMVDLGACRREAIV